MAEQALNQNSDTPKVSILVAIYNIEKFVGKCIQSIIDQDYKNLEIILVNDCSTDFSGKICDEFAEKDRRVLVTHHVTNTRQSGVRNTGLAQATGEYIVFVDGDDWLAPDFVSYMLGVIRETKADMVINPVNFTTRDHKQVPKNKIEIWSPEKATAEMLFPHISIGCWNKIYRRDFIEKHNLRFKTDLFTAEGYRFINEAAQRANHIGVAHRKVYYYRLNNTDSATTKPDVRQGTGALYALEGIERDMIIKTPYVMNALYQHIWKNYFWTMRQIIMTNSQSGNKELMQKCIRYVRKNSVPVASAEKSVVKKIRFYITGIFPTLAAHFVNCRFYLGIALDNWKNRGE
ncbi:glycosyltransferase family 2 protein [Sporolactobacillus terrae]|uniref:Glycosyl transferase n=1 Tax=Sporolactobacillus terrae TaxID=269673 RepID=A0ABX5Q4K9_9BACL|nr:glycosyltransferase family 2 protein [Sporolactobacillus terrae]QAA21581.1 glycosyl transferase [Sporolactobacillus terrae]QAA24553.1 glycosyl transferase [Sporolactobacillus terrae]